MFPICLTYMYTTYMFPTGGNRTGTTIQRDKLYTEVIAAYDPSELVLVISSVFHTLRTFPAFCYF